MAKEKYYPPVLAARQFHCPHCNVFAKQSWAHLVADARWANTFVMNLVANFSATLPKEWTISRCEHCTGFAIWNSERMIYPKRLVVVPPNEDLSQEIQKDYLEAANIFNESPRASAALLRLALQKLCKQLGEKGENINEDIKQLVQKGLNPQIQKSLDILRIAGNNAVHPGEINIEESPEMVIKLFDLINFISEKMITEVKEIEAFYEKLPPGAKEQIKKRDKS